MLSASGIPVSHGDENKRRKEVAMLYAITSRSTRHKAREAVLQIKSVRLQRPWLSTLSASQQRLYEIVELESDSHVVTVLPLRLQRLASKQRQSCGGTEGLDVL